MTDQNVPKRISEVPEATSSDLDAILGQLSLDEIRFLIARSETTTDKDAALAIGYTPRTIKGWPMERKELIREALRHMARDGLVAALHLRRRALAKAMAVKVRGLDTDDERLRQQTATEIIEWELGKATQPQQVDVTSGGAPIKITWGDPVIAPDE